MATAAFAQRGLAGKQTFHLVHKQQDVQTDAKKTETKVATSHTLCWVLDLSA
jgi:hypothetical protein